VKIALFIDQGRRQIILTPENKHECAMLGELREIYEAGAGNLSVLEGSFYACQGGWTRQGGGVSSTILVMDGERSQ
jgi:hypothetical protein